MHALMGMIVFLLGFLGPIAACGLALYLGERSRRRRESDTHV